MKSEHILSITMLLLAQIVSLSIGIAQEYTELNLPDEAIARFGKGWIKSISYSPDGTRLAVASSTGIWIYDADTGTEQILLTGNEHGTNSVVFSPDGDSLASGGYREILLWDVATSKILNSFIGHKGWVRVGFVKDSDTLISFGNRVVILWDIASGRKIREIKIIDSNGIRRFFLTLFGREVWSAYLYLNKKTDNGIAAIGYKNGIVRLKDATTGKQLREIQGHKDIVNQLTISPDGKILAVDIYNSPPSLWDIATGKKLKVLSENVSLGGMFTFSRDNKTLIYQTAFDGIELWNVESGKLRATLGNNSNRIGPITFSPDAKQFIGGSADGLIRTWDALTGKELSILTTGHTQGINAIAFSRDGNTLVVGINKTIQLWDTKTHTLISDETQQAEKLIDLTFSADDNIVTSICKLRFHIKKRDDYRKESISGELRLWNASNGEFLSFSPIESTKGEAPVLPNQRNVSGSTQAMSADSILKTTKTSKGVEKILKYQIHGLAKFSQNSLMLATPLNSSLATGNDRYSIILWDVPSRQVLFRLYGHKKEIKAIAFTADGKVLASGSKDGTIRLWDTKTGKQIQELSSGLKTTLAFSSDGNSIASVVNNNQIQLWDVSSGQKTSTLNGKIGECYALTYSPDRKFLASGSHDGTVLLWDVKTGRKLKEFIGHDNWIKAVKFSPDSKTLASGSEDGVIFLWNILN